MAFCFWDLGFSLGQMIRKALATSNGGFRNCKIHFDFSGQLGQEHGQANLHCFHPHMGQSQHTRWSVPCSLSFLSTSAFCHFRSCRGESLEKCDQQYTTEMTRGCIVTFPGSLRPQEICILVDTKKSMSSFKPQLG